METFDIRNALARAEKAGARLEDCFWLAAEEFVLAWKNLQCRTIPITEAATMGGLPVQLCPYMEKNKAAIINGDGHVFYVLITSQSRSEESPRYS